MFEFVRENPLALFTALLLHAALFGAFFLNLPSRPTPMPVLNAVDSVVVNPDMLLKPVREREAAERRARERDAADQRQRAEAERRREAEQFEREQRAQEAREAEVRRRDEQLRLQRDQEAAERVRREEAEKLRKEAAERERLEQIERKRREEEERRRREAELREQAQRESDLQRQLAEEEDRLQAANSGLLAQYIAMIQQRVIRNWNRPATARAGLSCKVDVVQAPGGTVLSVSIAECNGDAVVRQSIEAAVLRASPLPPPPDPRLFERNLRFNFEPRD
jgi:colicin import membrane protein